jgi:thiamine biosynthesis protein ThiI
MRCVLVHYHELALKGRNRPFFEQRLVQNLRSVLADLQGIRVTPLTGRVRIDLPDEATWKCLRERVAWVFGVANFSLAYAVPRDLEELKRGIGAAVSGLAFETFRVSTKRADKRFPLTSVEIDRELGAHVCALTGKRVDLRHPELTIRVEVLDREAFYSVQREPGPGGLPVGISGKVAALISGGIDSPVAASRMMKRGCRAVFIHFHGQPYVTRASVDKVRELVELLTRHQAFSRLYSVAFGDIQRRIVLGVPAPYRIVLYRRMMVRIAEELARKEGCWALITGDSLGQVASQTPRNLAVVEEAAGLPVLRPLIGMDKIEITAEAQRIGTFETSIEPDQDCCRLFVPPHPSTKADLDTIRKIEAGLDVGGLVKQGLEQVETEEFRFPRQ